MNIKPISLLSIPLILGSFFVAALAANSAPAPNSLIKASSDAVYFLGEDNKRYVFPNEKIFKTWYQDFSGVIEISDSELADYALGGNIFYRPGTRLLKITSDPKVYAVGKNGKLFPIPDETTALVLFGPDWATRVDDLSDAFFSGYSIQSELSSTEHPEGTVFQYEGESILRVLQRDEFGTLRAHPITSAQLELFGFSQTHVLQVPTSFTYSNGPEIDTTETSLRLPTQNRGNTSQEEAPPTPSPESAEVTFRIASGFSGENMLLSGKRDSELFGFTIEGDDDAAVTLEEITLSFYIDAGGEDEPDFRLGTDDDDSIVWPAQQLVTSVRLVERESKQLLSSTLSIPASGKLTFRPNLTIEANSETDILVLGEAVTIPREEVRIAVDFHTADDTVLTTNAKELTITPTEEINNGINPRSWVIPRDFGMLRVTSSTTQTSGFQPLDTETHVYRLNFFAEGEDFIVTQLSLGMTPDGNTAFAVNSLDLRYTNSSGSIVTKQFTDLTPENIFTYVLTDIFVPQNGSSTVEVYMTSEPFENNYSNSRLQFRFDTEDFVAIGQTSDTRFTEGNFADPERLIEDTDEGNLYILREGEISITNHFSRPGGTVNRQPLSHVFSFTLNALRENISVRKLSFELETSDVNVDGDDNDLFEILADSTIRDSIALYTYNADDDERTRITPSELSFAIVSDTSNEVDFTPQGRQTGIKDTGLFVFEFAGSGITISEGQSLSYMLEFNTTLLTTENDSTIKFKLLGDDENTAVSEANFLWNDGSDVLASGYLIKGLDLSGSTLIIPE